MNFYSMTDKGISAEIGQRIRSLRLRKNLTQQQIADAAALSLNAVKSVESGKAKLLTIIAVLRELGGLDALENLLPQASVSPLQLARKQGKKRVRASGKRTKNNTREDAGW